MKRFLARIEGIFVLRTDLHFLSQKRPLFGLLKSTVEPGDHFTVAACVPVTISNPNFKVQTGCIMVSRDNFSTRSH
jgi:hypothetical protein